MSLKVAFHTNVSNQLGSHAIRELLDKKIADTRTEFINKSIRLMHLRITAGTMDMDFVMDATTYVVQFKAYRIQRAFQKGIKRVMKIK